MQILRLFYQALLGLLKFIYKFAIYLTIFILLGLIALEYWVHIPEPTSNRSGIHARKEKVSEDFIKLGNNWMRKNKYGFWELYIEGNPYQRGQVLGQFCQDFLRVEEEILFEKIKTELPNPYLIDIAKYPVAILNRNANQYIPSEYQQELLGFSESKTDKYNDWATAYERTIYEQNLYEIGLAMPEIVDVKSSNLAVWNDRSIDGSMIVGHNQNFHISNTFTAKKMLAFINPSEGYKFAYVGSIGHLGVYSGMNEKGLVVNIQNEYIQNIGQLKTPIPLLSKIILQHAENAQSALEIAKQYEISSPVSILLSSAKDGTSFLLYKDENTTTLTPAEKNVITSSHHEYTKNRIDELLTRYPVLGLEHFASILRDKEGHNNQTLGFAYPYAINTLSQQTSAIYMPDKNLFWIAAPPHQLGTYIAYDLNEVFNKYIDLETNQTIGHDELAVAPDSFAYTDTYKLFTQHQQLTEILEAYTLRVLKGYSSPANAQDWINQLRSSNPNSYKTHLVIGDFRQALANQDPNWFKSAVEAYEEALTKAIPSMDIKISIETKLEYCKSRL